MKKKPANIATTKGFCVAFAHGASNYHYPMIIAPTATAQAHNAIAPNVERWHNQAPIMTERTPTKRLNRIKAHLLLILIVVTLYDILLKPRQKAPCKVLKHGIEGLMLLNVKRLVVDDFDGFVTFHLHNRKTITVALADVRFVNGGVFVADADYFRQA